MPITILVVEDETDLEFLITRKFRERIRSGELHFLFARSGNEALDQLAAIQDIDIIFSDIKMPEMDGLTLLSHVHVQYPLIRAIIITAYGDLTNIRAAMNRGAYDFLSKPIDFADLETTLNRAIREVQRLRRENAERRETEQQLLTLKRAVETIPLGVTIVNLDGKIIYTNPAEADMHGYDVAELIGRDVGVLTLSKLRKHVRVEEVRQWQGFVRESVNVRRGGQTFPVWLMSEIIKDADGEPQAIVTTCEDISDRKRLNQELQRSYERYALAANAGKTGVWEHDLLTDETFSDPVLKHIYGYTPQEFQDTRFNWQQQIYPDDWPALEALLAAQLRGDQAEDRVEVRITRQDRSVGWVEISSSIVYDASGRPTRFIGTTTDITPRKQAEEELHRLNQELEQRVAERATEFADLYNNAPVGYHSLRPDGLVLRMNDTELRWLGYTREEVEGRIHYRDLLTPDSQAEFDRAFSELRHTGQIVGLENEVICKSGAIIQGIVNATAVYDARGQFIMTRSTLLDHTERKRIERALQDSERNFRAFFDTIDYMLFVLDTRGTILKVNQTVTRLLGYTEDEMLGLNVLQLHPEARRQEAAEIVAAMVAGTRDACPVPLITKHGRLIPVETHVVQGTWSGQAVLFGITKDISGLQASEEKFAKVFYANPSPMALSELHDGRFIEVNEAFIQAVGYTRAEVIGQTSTALNLFADPAQRDILKQEIMTNGYVRNCEVDMRMKSGEIRQGLFSADLLHLQDRQILLTVMVDVTEQRRAEAELARAREEADAASRAKSEFLSNMSHELRTPLNSILGYAQILENADNLTERQRDGMRTIHASGEHLLTLITDILDLSKIEAGRMEVEHNEFRFPNFLTQIMRMIRIRAEQKQLTVTCECGPDLPEFLAADERKLRQVLVNLLGNAVKFTEQGKVVLRITNCELRKDQSEIRNLKFEIQDTGIGIAAEDLPDLFETFRQVGARRHATEGTGLGLAISAKFVELMGGTLQVSSTVGQGSRFWFELPVRIVAGSDVRPLPTSHDIVGYAGPRRTILIVDDKAANREILVNMLEPLGFQVVEAADGQQGLELALAQQPDLILLDLRMPNMDGFAMMGNLRADPAGRALKVAAVSASVQGDIRQRSLEAGCDDFLEKPVMVEALYALLETHLEVEWLHAHPGNTALPESGGTDAALPPSLPPALVAALTEAAERGDVRAIVAIIAQIEALDDGYAPFVERIRGLAKHFQVDEIAAILCNRKVIQS